MTAPGTRGSGPVPAHVLAAFGLAGRQSPLPGGRGLAVRVDDAVLLPAPDVVASTWAAEVAERIRSPDVRMPRPLRSRDGRWVVDLGPCGPQLLVRALLFRLLALDALTRDQPASAAAELPAHEAAARLVLTHAVAPAVAIDTDGVAPGT